MSPRVYLDLTTGVGGLPLYWTSGGRVRPVVSRIGNKWGYAGAICRIRGLSWRRSPDLLLLNDADPEIAGLWRCLLDPEIACAAAAMIRGWSGEEPRPLWDRLRARLSSGELSPPSVEWAATRLWVHRRSYQQLGTSYAPAESVRTAHFTGGLTKYKPDAPAPAIEALAEWAARIESTPTPSAVALNARAEEIPVPADARGWLVYADPPYQGTTGYRCEWPRADVLEVARRWADAGASVMISEAEPLDLPGWHHVEISALRRGQARTFSKQQREWLTLSERPAWRPPVQRSLFAVGAL